MSAPSPESIPSRPLFDWIASKRRYALATYVILFLTGIGFVAWWNAFHDPSIEAGAAMAGGFVALFLVGVNGLFLFALIEQIRTGEEQAATAREAIATEREALALAQLSGLREASPLLQIIENLLDTDAQMTLQNFGVGVARGVFVRVFALSGAMLVASVDTMATRPAGVTLDLKEDPSGHDVPLTEFDTVRVFCRDELGRVHVRWFDGRRETTGPDTVVPRGGAEPPPGIHPQFEFLARTVTRLGREARDEI